MTDSADRDSAISSRISRLEEREARLEERINADREARKEWREEIGRRLAELNNHTAQMAAERDHFLSKETYQAQHSSLERTLELRSRDLAHDNKEVLDVLDKKLAAHEAQDRADHEDHEKKIEGILTWVNNQKGRQWALGVMAALISGLVGVLVQVLIHIFSK